MAENKLKFQASIYQSPEAVLNFVADVRNRLEYQQSLTAISDIQGEPGVGQSWRWTWNMLGQTFEGTAETVEWEPGKSYAFVTEGAIASRFTYRAEQQGDATALTVKVEFDLPAELRDRIDGEQLMSAAQQKGDEALANLKARLER